MSETASHSGGCLCGAVRLTIAAEPMLARLCWCRLCQSLAAGTATVNVVFPSDKVAIEGDLRWYESTAESGNLMERGFCPSCGTPLFSRSDARPHLLIVRAGALDGHLVAREDHVDRGVAGGERLAQPAPAQPRQQRIGRDRDPHRATQAAAVVSWFSHPRGP